MEAIDTSRNEFQERRRHPRYECHIIDSLRQKITNLSVSGARLESARLYRLHEEIPLNFPVSSSNGNEAELQAVAVVTRVSESLGALKHKYGLLFSRLSGHAQKLLDVHLSLEKKRKESHLDHLIFYRLPRTDVTPNGDQFRLDVVLPDSRQVQFDLVNYSESGARISVKTQNFRAQIGTIWDKCNINLNGYPIYSGSVEIRDVKERDAHIEFGIKFRSDVLHLSRINAIKKLDDLAERFNAALSEVNGEGHAPIDFKVAVSDFRSFLEKMKNMMDESENEINTMEEPAECDWLKKQFMDHCAPPMKEKLHALIRRINDSIKGFSQEDHKSQQVYFRQQVSHLTNASVLYKRALQKPLGYAGDYLMMDILCQRFFDGQSLWEKIANYTLTSIPPGAVVRQRVTFILDKIRDKVSSSNGSLTRILNLACGSCEEIVHYIEKRGLDAVEFYLVDQEPRALEFSLRRCTQANVQNSASIPTYFIHHTVKQFLKDPQVPTKYPKMDLIYSVGLFDYLPDLVAVRLLAILYSMLNPSGELWIGNYNVKSEYRFMMDYATDWELIYRNEEDLQRLASQVPSNECPISIQTVGPEDANLFVVLRRKTG